MFNQSNQNKPPAFPLPQPLPSEESRYNWTSNDMPWKSTTEDGSGIMMFNGTPTPMPSTSGHRIFERQPRIKRKSESDEIIPSKHFISEEKMIAHLNGLHLSDNFQEHNLNKEQPKAVESDMSFVNLSPEELEQRLKSASRVIICDEVRKNLREDNEIIPKALLSRIEEPCRALILWRPPSNIEQLIVTGFGGVDEDEMDDNNNNDPNNNMDMDV